MMPAHPFCLPLIDALIDRCKFEDLLGHLAQWYFSHSKLLGFGIWGFVARGMSGGVGDGYGV